MQLLYGNAKEEHPFVGQEGHENRERLKTINTVQILLRHKANVQHLNMFLHYQMHSGGEYYT